MLNSCQMEGYTWENVLLNRWQIINICNIHLEDKLTI